ncbi:hypothetical protein HBZC1_10090 [Helicobacter bizzozeronii CIII-1]|uniref:Uncharacterized protein n=1 Tax=Helicobacter bizzozeronii (strain CIII-1) TaxID=1002804 RepID=F8KT48_HELBC|nr:hypothetical protein HBZC1_10090 [Helicobacter bizzozeronii CIII-1]
MGSQFFAKSLVLCARMTPKSILGHLGVWGWFLVFWINPP